MQQRIAFTLPFLLATTWCAAQEYLTFNPQVPVQQAGAQLAMPWAGGLNAPQFSSIDLDQDGVMDLFLLDRAGNKPLFLLNTGTANQPQYRPTRAYDQVFPFPLLHDWALMRDYNCDGKADLFAFTNGAFAVYRNTSNASGLSFTLADDQVGSNYVPTVSPNLYISNVDIPGIADLDGDGDQDILTFSIFGNFLEYHKNLSMELYGTCDSLVYEVRSRCWGGFQESMDGNAVTLNMPCTDNVPNPELPLHHGGMLLPEATDRAHSGSTTLPIDLDGDGDMDLILGDFASPDLTALVNGGTVAHAQITGMDTLFPVYGQRAYLHQFLGAFYLDVDGDGKRDLVVAPNSASASENAKSVWYYRNTGTDAAPYFVFQQEDLFQADMLDFGEGARPVLFDHNGDGLMDLVVANEWYFSADGNNRGRLALLENTGTAAAPAFNLLTEDYAALSAHTLGVGLHPAFGDVDGDGKADMVVGDAGGMLHFFRNTATGPVAQFQQAPTLLSNDLGQVIDVGANATPQLFDLNGDGLLDLVVGERNGNVNYFRNSGTAQVPQWHLESTDLGQVSVNEYWSATGYSVPFLHRDGAGTITLFSGSEVGGIHRYTGINGNLAGAWNLADSVWESLQEGWRTGIALYDFTGDGHLDAVIGNYRGGLSFWTSGTTTGLASAGTAPPGPPFTLAPNPAQEAVEVRWHAPLRPDLRADLLDGLGRTVRSMAMASGQVRMALAGLAPGLYTVKVGRWSRPLAIVR